MKQLKLYYLEENYINYLRKFDTKVPYNKRRKRPYIGIVYTFENHNYFAPLSSPKEKHLKMSSNAIDIFKIQNGTLGIININNMLPTPLTCAKEILPLIKDPNYKILLEKQLTYINNHKAKLFSQIKQFYRRYKSNHLSKSQYERCCNFSLLEEKSLEYQDNIFINN